MIIPGSIGCISRSVPPLLLAIAGTCAIGSGTVGLVSIPPVEITISGAAPLSEGTVGLVAIEQATVAINGVLPMTEGIVGVTTDAIFDVTGVLPMTTGTVGLEAIAPVEITISGVLPMSVGTVGLTAAPIDLSTANLDGSNDYLSLAYDADISLSGDFSLSAWLKPGNTSTLYLFSRQSGGTYSQIVLKSGLGEVNIWKDGASPSPKVVALPASFSTGSWQHFTIVRESGILTAYRNASAGTSATSYTQDLTLASIDMTVGGSPGDSSYNLTGMAFWGFWTRALSGSEVSELYNSGAPKDYASVSSGLKSSMKAYYELAEWTGHTGSALVDQTGNCGNLSNNGSIPFNGTGLTLG